jgi:hypothetical protein
MPLRDQISLILYNVQAIRGGVTAYIPLSYYMP